MERLPKLKTSFKQSSGKKNRQSLYGYLAKDKAFALRKPLKRKTGAKVGVFMAVHGEDPRWCKRAVLCIARELDSIPDLCMTPRGINIALHVDSRDCDFWLAPVDYGLVESYTSRVRSMDHLPETLLEYPSTISPPPRSPVRCVQAVAINCRHQTVPQFYSSSSMAICRGTKKRRRSLLGRGGGLRSPVRVWTNTSVAHFHL